MQRYDFGVTTICRLGPGDEPTLALLAIDDADFDSAGRGEPLEPRLAAAAAYLANPAVLTGVAVEIGDDVTGFLYCVVVPLRSGAGRELLLYEIGVRTAWRRRGIGRALLAQMEAWMGAQGIEEVWVLADNPIAIEFYRGCAFAAADDQPTYMTRELTDY